MSTITADEINDRLSREGLLDMQQFSSSNIHSALYDRPHQDLYVRFHGNRIYLYEMVPESVWEAWKQAPSAGSFHHEHIKWNYRYEELSSSDWPQQGRAAPRNNTVTRRFVG